jgi:lipoprotein-releasing system permease protein
VISSFELFVAGRYLRARRKEKVVSVITVISVIGVAAGVMALIIAMAVSHGFQSTIERNMLAATAHINVLDKDPGVGIDDWRSLMDKLRRLPHVVAVAPVLYDPVVFTGALGRKLVTLKGVDTKDELATSDTLRHLQSGSLDELKDDSGLPGLIIGAKLATDGGLKVGSVIKVLDPQGTIAAFGPMPHTMQFRVAGIFETDFFDVDDTWAYAALPAVQRLGSTGDVVNTIELRLDDPDRAPEMKSALDRVLGRQYSSITWQEQNAQQFRALKLERVVIAITIGLIEMVGALNILITLTMIVLTKYKDIAVLMSMGARRGQIRRIFVMQGLMIGVIGTVIGLIVGYTFCHFAAEYRWIPLDESVYALSYVPFNARAIDGLWISVGALAVSLLATLYPARNAVRITPVEVLRYE